MMKNSYFGYILGLDLDLNYSLQTNINIIYQLPDKKQLVFNQQNDSSKSEIYIYLHLFLEQNKINWQAILLDNI